MSAKRYSDQRLLLHIIRYLPDIVQERLSCCPYLTDIPCNPYPDDSITFRRYYMKVLVVFYSLYGYIYKMAEAIAGKKTFWIS